ncbi:MAG: hypothetical protein E6J00_02445 [Chloroflexi bacterium]|nr:MAG: hypothetical protein E6J00_02445 [Chloroflexota bacterium]
MSEASARRRAKVSVTVDPVLLEAVDLYVQRHEGTDRSRVMERALLHWYAARQEEAMVEQFQSPDPREESERLAWKRTRRAAAERRLRRPGS